MFSTSKKMIVAGVLTASMLGAGATAVLAEEEAPTADASVSIYSTYVWKEDIPEITSYDAMIVLGGGPNVDQEATYPFLAAEKKAIQKDDARKYSNSIGAQFAKLFDNFFSFIQ